MKLSEILGRILTDYALRQTHSSSGVCRLVGSLVYASDSMDSEELQAANSLMRSFEHALEVCKQTQSRTYPVSPADWPVCSNCPALTAMDAYHEAGAIHPETAGNMWRGQYGQNRRRLVRDTWRWAKARGL